MPSKSKKLQMIVPSDLTSAILADEPAAPVSTPVPDEAPANLGPVPNPTLAPAIADPSSKRRRSSKKDVDVAPALRRGHQLQASGRVVRRMTVNLELELGDELAKYCAATRRTQSDVISEGLRLVLGGT